MKYCYPINLITCSIRSAFFTAGMQCKEDGFFPLTLNDGLQIRGTELPQEAKLHFVLFPFQRFLEACSINANAFFK